MDWIQSLLEWARDAMTQTGLRPLAFPLAFIVGAVSAVASTCCTFPVLAAIIGYSGARDGERTRERSLAAVFFMLGTIIALVVLGSVAGFIGEAAQAGLGKYWGVFAGFAAILFGLATLNVLPFSLPAITGGKTMSGGAWGAAIFGFILGGAVGVCSLPCNPGLFVLLSVAVLQGYTFWMLGLLLAYAVGFSLPLTALLLGVSFGKTVIKASRAKTAIQYVAGTLLVVVGFYFLWNV